MRHERGAGATDTGAPVEPTAADVRAAFWERAMQASLTPLLVLDETYRVVVASTAVSSETGQHTADLIGVPIESVVLAHDGEPTIRERLDRCASCASNRRPDGCSPDGSEFGVLLRTTSGDLLPARALLRRDVLDGREVYVLSLRTTTAGEPISTAIRRRVELELLLDTVQHGFTHADPSEIRSVMSLALKEITEFLGADRGYVLRYDMGERTESMIYEWARPGVEPVLATYTDMSFDEFPAAIRRLMNCWACAVRDVSQLGEEWAVDRSYFESAGVRSILELPLVINGEPVGSLGFDWTNSLAEWTEDDLTLMGMFASTFAQTIGRDAAEHELARRSTHDELTGLPNRLGLVRLLDSTVRETRRSGGGIGVLHLDLDHFKVLNDLLGDTAGDELLRLVAARIRGVIRPTDIAARLGADEFAVVLVDSIDEWSATQMAERLRASLAEPFEVHGRAHLLTASCGIAIGDDPAATGTELLRRAGAAMYRAKELGRSRQTVFDFALEERLAARLELDQQLRRALARNEFEVFFQPEIELSTGRVLGAEALLRWRCDGQLRDAYTFIDIVEETGLIIPVGRWVLDEACRQAASWVEMLDHDDFVIRVNLSPRQLEDPTLVDAVDDILRRHGLAPRHLCLEITETAVMGDAQRALELLTRLDALGLSLAIDDFGTGYSSLSYLKRFPVDILKIDRSFVDGLPDDPEDFAIVRTIIQLAESLGMTVTAEGIETIEHARALIELGCDRGQGWFYSKAVPADELVPMLESGLVAAARTA